MKRETKGLKAHSRRGRIGRTWWSQRWTTVLESIGLGDRLHRGRSLARAGNILTLELEPGEARAEVRGNRTEVFTVCISMPRIPPSAWDTLQEILARRALFAAKLLAGEMPEPIEEAFAEAGLSLFPSSAEEITADCNCADPARPCQHAAAVFYLMAERFDQDPFLIFLFRGRDREELLSGLKHRWAQGCGKEEEAEATAAGNGAGAAGTEGGALSAAEVPADSTATGTISETETARPDPPREFWELSGDLDALVPRIQPPTIPEAVLRRLGPPPGTPAGTPADVALHRAYKLASEWALRLAMRDEGQEK